MNNDQFQFRPPLKMILSWSFASLLCVGLGMLPWVPLLQQNDRIPSLAIVILTVWSSPPILMGMYILHLACRSTKLTLVDQNFIREEWSLLGLRFGRDIRFQAIYCFKHQQIRRRKVDEQLAIFLKTDSGKKFLANEQSCRDIGSLFDWLNTQVRESCFDFREQAIGLNPRYW